MGYDFENNMAVTEAEYNPQKTPHNSSWWASYGLSFVRLFKKINDDVIKWKQFPRYWPFVWGIHRSPVNSPHKGQWRGALMFTLICAWINGWVNNREAGDLRRHRAHFDVSIMWPHSYVTALYFEGSWPCSDDTYYKGTTLYLFVIGRTKMCKIPDLQYCDVRDNTSPSLAAISLVAPDRCYHRFPPWGIWEM